MWYEIWTLQIILTCIRCIGKDFPPNISLHPLGRVLFRMTNFSLGLKKSCGTSLVGVKTNTYLNYLKKVVRIGKSTSAEQETL